MGESISTPLSAEQICRPPKIRAGTLTTPLNSCYLGSGRCVWKQGQEQAGPPLQSSCSTANCRFHSWVELSKSHPSTLSSELLSWCSLLPAAPPSKPVYTWKDAATVHPFLQTSQFEIEAFLRLLCEHRHMPTVMTTRAKPSMDEEAASLPECPRQQFFPSLFLLLLLETWVLWNSL